jgi:hypothetical protein
MGARPDISEGGQGGCEAALDIRMSYVFPVFDRPSTFNKNETPYKEYGDTIIYLVAGGLKLPPEC